MAKQLWTDYPWLWASVQRVIRSGRCTLSLSHTHKHTHTHQHPTHTLSHTHRKTHTHTQRHTHTHTHTHTHDCSGKARHHTDRRHIDKKTRGRADKLAHASARKRDGEG